MTSGKARWRCAISRIRSNWSNLLKRYPSNGILKLVALANKDSIEIDAAALGLLREADPGELSERMNKGLSGRGNLEALGRDLKAAEENAAGLESRYDTLVKSVRDGIEHDAAALEGGANMSAKFMAMIDAQHAEMKALMAKISAARLDYFRAYEKCVALLAKENDVIKVVNGQITFRLQAQADSYNEAAAATAAIAKPPDRPGNRANGSEAVAVRAMEALGRRLEHDPESV